jgi:hypothetical protein
LNISFPSPDFDDAVAAVCHGSLPEEQARALNALLRTNAAARDEYLLRIEIHSRLASEPDLFAGAEFGAAQVLRAGFGESLPQNVLPLSNSTRTLARRRLWLVALAACLALVAGGWWGLRFWNPVEKKGTTSRAVAMLNRVVDARWKQETVMPRLGAPLEPGWLRLESGLAQIVFYSGARVVIQGPAEVELISQNRASCRSGRLTAEVPPQARGFLVATPQVAIKDLGTSFGLEVANRRTELHVFKGSVEFEPAGGKPKQSLREGAGLVVEDSQPPRLVAVNPGAFASLFGLQTQSVAAEARRYGKWRATSRRLNGDPSLLVHLDFESGQVSEWRLRNLGRGGAAAPDAAIVGCQWIQGRWPEKRALEFQSVSDRVRLSVPGQFASLTLAAWVRVQGLDRKINSLFMCDGFEPGTVHWLIRNDGALGLTVISPVSRHHQIVASRPVLTLDQFGMWLHLAVVLDGDGERVVHYVNGLPVGEKELRIDPPFRIGATELGNWNAKGFPGNDAFLIRNFSGAMDEFLLFGRALNAEEIGGLYTDGKPQPDSLTRADQGRDRE